MKRILFLAVIAMIFVPASYAQLAFGLKAGVSFNSLSWDNTELAADDSGMGYFAGVLMEYIDQRSDLGFDLSAMISNENLKLIYHKTSGDTQVDRSNLFVKIPVNLKWKPKFLGNKIIKPMIYTGPEVALILPFDEDKDSDQRRFKAQSLLAWNFGLGAEIIDKLQVNFQYSIGLNPAIKYEHTLINGKAEAKHNAFSVSLVWMFR